MSNDLVSLDDIIKKKKTTGTMRNPGVRRPMTKNVTKVAANGAAAAAPNRLRTTHGTRPVQDARFKIIQKKRTHIADARDKLAQIAKQSDARLKLQKLRATNVKKVEPANNAPRKTGRMGRVALSTNKVPAPHIPRSMPSFIPPHTRPMSYRPPPIPEPHYVSEMMMGYNNDYLMDHQAALRRTVSNDYAPSLPPPPPIFNIKPTPYDWDKPNHGIPLSRSQPIRALDQSRPRDYKVIPRAAMPKNMSAQSYRDNWAFSSKSRTILPDSAIAYAIRNHRDIGVKSRLDSPPPKANRSLAAITASRPKTNSQTPGYRIVVSNLQPNVTQEDIKELFEDVGELLISRLVRPGTAEVIYKTLKDATKAVETYHNRQLDGHPMKCLLVNPRPKMSGSTSSGRILAQARSSSGYSYPSLGMVHRALFDD